MVDGKKAYEGETKQNLGYYTIRFDPIFGKSVTIQMTGAGQDRDGFGLVEVAGKVDRADQKNKGQNAEGKLKIVELEVYSPVNK